MPRPAAAVALLLALTACSGGAEREPDDADAALQAARGRLAQLARATANGSYDAQYRFVQTPENKTGTIRIRQSPPQYRIDIVANDGASFFALNDRIVSCGSKDSKRTCFLVARPGEPVPGIFDPGVQRLFRDAVEDLAANPGGYLVTPTETATPIGAVPTPTAPSGTATPSAKATPTASPLPIPPGECFRVERVAPTPEPDQPAGFENGTYCFAEQGVATSIAVRSGTLTLVKLLGPPPPAAFVPPAKVQRLPELRSPTPTPTPSKKK